ncbi:MAG: Protein-arginine-phosphatase [Syntrophus sp. SKADARSKE-3]|nr:Protein-arginine-phosphatase [Syntrophus sp. SKADARSKE-3]
MVLLFVCKANIVRSYMAEGILKEKLRRAQRFDITVHSAGLIDMHGSQADPAAEKILEEKGYSLPGHQSKLLTREMMEQADWIIVMEALQQSEILESYPEGRDKIRLLKSFSRDFDGSNTDIKDPYRQSTYLYRLCFSEIYLAMDGLMKCI